jgi:hypothetical protein
MRVLARSIGISLALVGASLSSKAQEAQIVPILSNFYHWDHHWFIWLPGDPLYEAVEVMSKQRGGGTPPLVWVFFTERSGPKRQVHYFNNAQVASARGAHFREIVFTMTGAEDQARGAHVSLSDAEGRPTTVDVDFASDAQLVTQGAGLTDQSGHAVDYHLLFFFRERNTLARDVRAVHVVRAGVDVAHPTAENNHPVPAQHRGGSRRRAACRGHRR